MIENIALSKKHDLSTPENIIREIIHRRATGGFIAILAWRLTETIPDVSIARRVMDAVYNNKSLEECFALLQTRTEVTRRESDYPKEESLR